MLISISIKIIVMVIFAIIVQTKYTGLKTKCGKYGKGHFDRSVSSTKYP